MKYRCPSAKVAGKTILKDWRLRFRGSPHNAVATIEPAKGYSVPVGIWEISKDDETALDIYEGYPRLYRKEVMSVILNGQQVSAMIYLMNEDYPYNNPCYDYVRTILDGYIAFDLDKEILREAVTAARRTMHYD